MKFRFKIFLILTLFLFAFSQYSYARPRSSFEAGGEERSVDVRANETRAEVGKAKSALETVREQKRVKVKEKVGKAGSFGAEKIEEVKKLREQKREELKTRLAKLKDQRKAKIAQRIAERMETVNSNRVRRFRAVLDKLSKVLDKLEVRAEEGKNSGLDVSSVEAAVEAARSAIANASALVDAQEAKVYEITITDEGSLRNDIGYAVSSLQSDLSGVRAGVKESMYAVRNAFSVLKGLRAKE